MENLSICRTSDGKKIWQVVTNIKNIKNDGIYSVVHLPPTMFGTVISEAMFVSDIQIGEKPGVQVIPEGPILNNINNQVFLLLEK